MNRPFLAALIILAGYLYGTLLYPPWYRYVQRLLIKSNLINLKTENPETEQLLGNAVQIVIVSLLLLGFGIWYFVASRN